MHKVILVDGNALAFRSLFSHEMLTSKIKKKIVYTGMPYGFLQTLITVSKEYNTNNFIIFWDGGSKRKKEIYPGYKKDRKIKVKNMNFKDIKNSLKLCTKIVKRIGLEQYRVRGEEGDDIIASYIHQNPDAEYLILSNDKDFFQLLNKNVRIVRMNRGESVLWTRKSFKKEFGFKPKYYADYLAIVGDSVDKIPGIRGIGPTIGNQIFQQISKPNIENIMNKVNDLELSDKQKEKILTGKKDAELFFQLTKLSTSIELKPLFVPKHNIRKLINLFVKLEFRSIYENEKNMTAICDLKS